jgi:hypothetical protein
MKEGAFAVSSAPAAKATGTPGPPGTGAAGPVAFVTEAIRSFVPSKSASVWLEASFTVHWRRFVSGTA